MLSWPLRKEEPRLRDSYITQAYTSDNNIASPQNIVGSITYSNNITSNISIPESGGVRYHAQILNQQGVVGMHINSHRHQQNYQQVSSIPTNAIGAEQAYGVYFNELMQRFQGGHSQFSPTYRMKEAIISMATFGPGNSNVQGNPDIERLFNEFKTILRKLLPPTMGFMDISVRIPDVVLTTRSGEFILDAASGGLSSIIDLAWQIFLFAHNKEDFCVSIDEPENHLHPSMQRSLLSRLTDAFPKAQFIVVTHRAPSSYLQFVIRQSTHCNIKNQANPLAMNSLTGKCNQFDLTWIARRQRQQKF